MEGLLGVPNKPVFKIAFTTARSSARLNSVPAERGSFLLVALGEELNTWVRDRMSPAPPCPVSIINDPICSCLRDVSPNDDTTEGLGEGGCRDKDDDDTGANPDAPLSFPDTSLAPLLSSFSIV